MAAGKIALSESSYNLTVGVNGTLIDDISFNIPSNLGSANQVLTTDGSGNLDWATVTSETTIIPTDNFLKWNTSGNYYYPYQSRTLAGSLLSFYQESTVSPSLLATPLYLHINGSLVAGSIDSGNNRNGVSSFSYSGDSFIGISTTGNGLSGISTSGKGLNALTTSGTAVYGSSSSGLGSYFNTVSNSIITSFANSGSVKASILNTGQLTLTGVYTLPATAGTSGYILSSAGTGNTLAWIAAPTGGVTPTDNILDWDGTNSYYQPYTTRAAVTTALKFYSDNSNPIPNANSTGRLSLNGSFIAGSTNSSYSKIGVGGYSYSAEGIIGDSYSSIGISGNSETSYGGYFNTNSGTKIAGFGYAGTEKLYVTSTGNIQKDTNYIVLSNASSNMLFERNGIVNLAIDSTGVEISGAYHLPSTSPGAANKTIVSTSSSASTWLNITPTIVVTNETELLAAFTTLNSLGGGKIIINGIITLTAARLIDFTNIEVENGTIITADSSGAYYFAQTAGKMIFRNVTFANHRTLTTNTFTPFRLTYSPDPSSIVEDPYQCGAIFEDCIFGDYMTGTNAEVGGPILTIDGDHNDTERLTIKFIRCRINTGFLYSEDICPLQVHITDTADIHLGACRIFVYNLSPMDNHSKDTSTFVISGALPTSPSYTPLILSTDGSVRYADVAYGGKTRIAPTPAQFVLNHTTATFKSPASTSYGIRGDICADDTYIYVCTDHFTWKRVALSTY